MIDHMGVETSESSDPSSDCNQEPLQASSRGMKSSYLYFIRITSVVMYRIRRRVKRERLIVNQLENQMRKASPERQW